MPEPTKSRVTKSVEHIIHLTKIRTPYFDKESFRTTPAMLGGRNTLFEQDKVTDVWHLPTSSGGDGHGAQFPLALPGRCIALSTKEKDVVLDPFAGSGTSGLAALKLKRQFIGFDVSQEYVELANKKLAQEGETKGAGRNARRRDSSEGVGEAVGFVAQRAIAERPDAAVGESLDNGDAIRLDRRPAIATIDADIVALGDSPAERGTQFVVGATRAHSHRAQGD